MKAMEDPQGSSSSALRKWGPLVVVVVVVAAVVGLLLSRGSGDDTASSTTTASSGGSGSAALPKGVVSYSAAKADGTAGDIDWGKRCDTDTGVLAIPIFPAPECYKPFSGDNGGATSTGVTADSVKLVVYLP